jgi:hypothetical protein
LKSTKSEKVVLGSDFVASDFDLSTFGGWPDDQGPVHQRDGDERPDHVDRQHREQHREREHERVQEGAGRLPGPLYVTQRAPGSEAAAGLQVPTGLQIGSGARVAGITKVFTPGALVNTQNPLDVAVEGEGFFQVTLPSGELRYTRDGALRLNAQGNLVTSDGFLINPQISIPTTAVSISVGSDGTISAQNAGALNTSTVLGQLTLVRFQNTAGLSAEGRNLFAETASSGAPAAGGARAERGGVHPPRVPGAVERGRGDRADQPDPGAAGVRVQHPGRPHRRQHARVHHRPDPVAGSSLGPAAVPAAFLRGCDTTRGAGWRTGTRGESGRDGRGSQGRSAHLRGVARMRSFRFLAAALAAALAAGGARAADRSWSS